MSPTKAQNGQRSSRVKLGGSVLALVLLENGRQIRARMNQLSVNGGLLSLERPLDEGIKVTALFHVGATSIRTRAESLFPMWATKGCFQPIRFLDLPEQDRISLAKELEAMVRAGAPEEDDDENLSNTL
jgi:hemerythrin superfamily protein